MVKLILTITLNAAIDKRYVTSGARQGEVNRILECEYTAGGKGLNVSKILAISGARVLAGGFTGGYAGRYIEDSLKKYGIVSDFYHVTGESRSCINIWDEKTKQQTEYLEPGFTVTEAELEGFLKQYQGQLQKAQIIAMSGSVPKGVGPDIYRKLIELAHAGDKKVILDSSGDLLRQGLEAQPDLVKPNIDEIRMLTGKSCDDMGELAEAAMEIHKKGVSYVVISLGGEGSLLAGREGVYRAKVPKIHTVNTVGCGDAMVAGFALGLEEGLSPEEMLKKAGAISTASAMSEGTGHYDIAVMRQIYKDIVISKIN